MNISPVEELFTVFNETALIIQEELEYTYLESLALTGENIFQEAILQEELSELSKKRLKKSYETIHLAKYSKEEIRKAFQLVILKGMKENTQPNHQMTPDSIGILFGYLVQKFYTSEELRLLDLAVGTGNLLTTVMNHQVGKNIAAYGVDIDDLLLQLALVNANLQEQPIEFFNQDSLEHLFIDPVDVVVSDLPVGYYPNDIRANEFKVKAEDGHTYAHHLFIEQSINYVKPGGYAFFVIPNNLFESEQAAKLHDYIKEEVHIQAIMQLPETLFKNKQSAKSILILQKKGNNIVAPKQVLLAKVPSFSNMRAMEQVLSELDTWIQANK
ncbi:SAM-dependent methyltransferase [Niallia circulans]|jgi:site-specific DNA-methyltransferase (adenine-specific)|uniref:class I SAM-dependent methyltransferase n=1 Tax=Niallia TaxID=2837506 RepID=UPI00077CB89F|nr:class I SAM-dependent methyltransferase [Niallia circulans]MDR4317266.1 class I SAM-dependent methyltransferase [Niallia circulans]MED3838756.1 class I SAM-dependent methyltransferase [Niallia circulans]MED4245152.1 class I SAM-dependent methyltransferase [Niallia circulans]MED4248699.1 class I SAM-dependent methyltransferase [Niallia circulans]PAD26333.1 SAM-dependent methyltransferase [Niallia circulans]